MAKFAANNHESAAPKTTPFLANYGFHSCFDNSLPPKDHSSQSLDAQQFATNMMELQDFLRAPIRTTQNIYEETTNHQRTPAPAFQVGDEVFLSTKNIPPPAPHAHWTGSESDLSRSRQLYQSTPTR